MAASRHSGVRVLVTAVILLLASLLGAQTAYAQLTAQVLRPATTAPAFSAAPAEHSGTAEDDSKPRHGPRRSAGLQATAGTSDRVCDCDVRTASRHCFAAPVTVREGALRGRSVDLPLLHRTFRC